MMIEGLAVISLFPFHSLYFLLLVSLIKVDAELECKKGMVRNVFFHSDF